MGVFTSVVPSPGFQHPYADKAMNRIRKVREWKNGTGLSPRPVWWVSDFAHLCGAEKFDV